MADAHNGRQEVYAEEECWTFREPDMNHEIETSAAQSIVQTILSPTLLLSDFPDHPAVTFAHNTNDALRFQTLDDL